jgi:hypothetical protein
MFRIGFDNHVLQKQMTRGEAEARAKRLSEGNADRYVVYRVVSASGQHEGRTDSIWVRGSKCAPDHLPRVEVHERPVSDDTLIAVIPVVDGDETWSVNAAGKFRLRTSSGLTYILVAADGARTDLTAGGCWA